MSKYPQVWLRLLKNSFSSILSNRIDAATYLGGKIIRFGFFWLLIISLFQYTETFAGYSKYQVLFFFLTFNLVDVLSQVLFRGIYFFTNDVRKGNFDFTLIKPVHPLFLVLSKLIDLLDIFFLAPIIILIVYILTLLPITITFTGITLYIFLILLALIIALAFHIIIAAATIWSYENENFIWLYREMMTLGRFPPDILPGFLQIVLVYFVPVIIMVAYPVNALFGLLSLHSVLLACAITLLFFGLSLVLWKLGMRRYSSVSS